MSVAVEARADATYQVLPLTQNWSTAGLITANDNWSGVPGIVGYRGDGLTGGSGTDPQTLLGNDVPGVIDVQANLTDPLTASTGGVAEFELTDPAAAIAGSGTASAPYLVLHVNSTGRRYITVSYKLRDLEGVGGTDNAVQAVALQFRTSGSGSWTNVPAGFVADATAGPGQPLETQVSAQLPAAADDQPTLQIRIITTNAVGSDEWVGVDDILVEATQRFVDATSGPLGDANSGTGVAWGDFDGDADLDLYLVNNGQANKLFRNDAGVWVDATSGALGVTGFGVGAAAADFDNDGDLDIFSNKGPCQLLRNDAGTWVSASIGALGGSFGGRGIAPGDFDADGDLDLFLSNDAGPSKMFRNDAGTWLDVTAAPLGLTTVGQGATAGDFDADGDLDLYQVNSSGGNRLFRNEGGGAWVDATSGALSASGNGRGVAAGDFDNDGDLDLYVAKFGGTNALLRNDAGTWVNATSGPLGDTGAGTGATFGDADNDGDLDLYLVNSGTANKLFRNDGASWVDDTRAPLGDTGTGRGVIFGDYDNDGDVDLYLANTGSANKLFRNDNGLGNAWLNVKLVGTVSNRSGVGARVRVVAGGVSRMDEIAAGSSYVSQNSLTAEFGLGTASVIDSLIVRWPNGIVQVASPVPPVNTVVTLTEPVHGFTDVTNGVLGDTGNGHGAAWGDYDGDGDLDLYVSNDGQANKLMRNDAETFVDATSGPLGDTGAGRSVAWGDYDNDGDLDLFLANTGGAELSRLFRNDGGTFAIANSGSLNALSGKSGAWGDRNNDGLLDLFTTSVVRLQAGGTWQTNYVDVNIPASICATWADYDNDNDLDLFVVGDPVWGLECRLYRNEGASWADATPAALSSVGAGTGASLADYDNDGDLDLYLASTVHGIGRLLRNDGGSWNSMGLIAAGYGSAWADYDNDGDLDLYRDRLGGEPGVLYRNDSGSFTGLSDGPLGATDDTRGVAWGDYDGDGDLDLYIVNNGQPNRLLRNENLKGNHWLHVRLQGSVSNRSGIGARVRVVTGGVGRIQEISGGSGYMSQNSLDAEFGLGASTSIDSLIVRWPSGITQVVTPVPAVDQRVTVTEPLPQFSSVASGAIASTLDTRGAAWADVDQDGDLDLYMGNGGANILARNDSGTWVDATSGALGNAGNTRSVIWGDADNDGDLDLYIANLNSSNVLVRNDAGTWVDATSGPLGDAGEGTASAWGDFDGDGDLDLYLVNYAAGSVNHLFRNDGGSWVDATSGPLGTSNLGVGAVAADFDNDGDLDLYLVNGTSGANKMFRNDSGTWVDVTTAALAPSITSAGASAGDYDNDGDLDLYVTAFPGGHSNRLLRNNGTSWSNATSGPLGVTTSSRTGAWGDMDNDGDLDLFVTCINGANRLFRNDSGTWADVETATFGENEYSSPAVWGDYDGDGDLDLFKGTGGATPNRLYRNDLANGNHWLHVDLVGVISNRSGIGARVRVLAGGVSRIVEISGGSSYSSQNSLTAEFGLGASTLIDSLVIRWPSGIVWDTTGVAVDQRIVLVEQTDNVAVTEWSGLPHSLELSAGMPNPFHSSTRIEYALPAAARVNLAVHDVQGRRVATLAEGERKPGRFSVRWDGRGEGGRARAGLYFVRLTVRTEDGERTMLRKLVLTR
jgi:hypothetical protein